MLISEKKQQVTSSEQIAEIMIKIHEATDESDRHKEHFWVIGINTKNVIQYIELVSLGTMTASLVHPREVFRFSVMKSVAALIFCHNHPSGDPKPSQEDTLLTKRLKQAGDILGIQVLDHIILGEKVFSFRDSGLIANS